MITADQLDTTDIDLLAELIGEDETFDETVDIDELDNLLVPVSFSD